MLVFENGFTFCDLLQILMGYEQQEVAQEPCIWHISDPQFRLGDGVQGRSNSSSTCELLAWSRDDN